MVKKRRLRFKRAEVFAKGRTQEPVPLILLRAFTNISKNDWKDEEIYQAYLEKANEYLGDLKDDRIEQGKLVVGLSRMMMGRMTRDWKLKDEELQKIPAE